MKRHLFKVEYFGEEKEKDLLLETKNNATIDDIFDELFKYDKIISEGKTKQVINLNWDKIKSIKYKRSTNI
jgi:hypothetical protein